MLDSAQHEALRRYLDRCTFVPEQTVLRCAVSGGADSLALMVLAISTGRRVEVVHVDHGIRAESGDDAEAVRAVSQRFGVRCDVVAVHVEPGPNLEARARTARYAALPADALTAHTADDQAETVLLQLVRGAGWDGLSGIGSPERRPLLGLRRADTEAVCDIAQLQPLHDPSNDDPTHRRNRMRHEVLPLLDEIAGRDVTPLLNRHAALAAENAASLRAAVGPVDATDTRALQQLAVPLARVALRDWLANELPGHYPPDFAAIERVLAVVRHEIRSTEIPGGWRVRRTDGMLRVEPLAGM